MGEQMVMLVEKSSRLILKAMLVSDKTLEEIKNEVQTRWPGDLHRAILIIGPVTYSLMPYVQFSDGATLPYSSMIVVKE